MNALQPYKTSVPLWRHLQRMMSTKVKKQLGSKFRFDIDPKVGDAIRTGALKPRNHPGIQKIKPVSLPPELKEAIPIVLADYPQKNLEADAVKLSKYIWSRHPPLEGIEYEEKMATIREKILHKEKISPLSPGISEEERKRLMDSLLSKIDARMKKEIYHWKRIEYNDYMSAVYILARMCPDYAALVKVFSEIKKRDTDFCPVNVLDCGSGVGSGMWAVDCVWPKVCKEVLCVDVSAEMNATADRLLRRGNIENDRLVRPGGTMFKQFLPMSDIVKYDLVIASRSLFELPDMESRLQMLDIIWRKTAKYLVIVEAGTNAGYKVVLEARDYILQLGKNNVEEMNNLESHVFAPCPHEVFCPKYLDGSYTPCNFVVRYEPFSLSKNKGIQTDTYSYMVLKKGKDLNTEKYPRLVKEPQLRKNHAICRLCTKYGTLADYIATKKKHSKECYNVLKHSNWGDLLPIVLPEAENTNSVCNDTAELDHHSSEDECEAKA